MCVIRAPFWWRLCFGLCLSMLLTLFSYLSVLLTFFTTLKNFNHIKNFKNFKNNLKKSMKTLDCRDWRDRRDRRDHRDRKDRRDPDNLAHLRACQLVTTLSVHLTFFYTLFVLLLFFTNLPLQCNAMQCIASHVFYLSHAGSVFFSVEDIIFTKQGFTTFLSLLHAQGIYGKWNKLEE